MALGYVLTVLFGSLTLTRPLQMGADDVLAAAFRAHGGAAVAAVQAVLVQGVVHSRGVSQPIVISARLDGHLRLDYGQPPRRSVISTPRGRLEVRDGQIHPQPPHVGLFAQFDLLSILGLRHFGAAGVQRTVLGAGTIQGRSTRRIQAQTQREQVHYGRVLSDAAEVQLDAATGLVAAIARQQYADRSLDLSFLRMYVFSDYREVSGVMFPFRIEKYIDGILHETIVVGRVQFNPVFGGTLFEP